MVNPIKSIQKWNLDRKQRQLDKEFEKNGYSDELLEKQVQLNEKKFKLNIPEKDYVQ